MSPSPKSSKGTKNRGRSRGAINERSRHGTLSGGGGSSPRGGGSGKAMSPGNSANRKYGMKGNEWGMRFAKTSGFKKGGKSTHRGGY